MNATRRKELLEGYRNRRPEMGVISLRCTAIGEAFLDISQDTRVSFNSVRTKLESGYHPNRRLRELRKQYGQSGFECSVIKTLSYEDPHENQTAKLEALRSKCLAQDPLAQKLWK